MGISNTKVVIIKNNYNNVYIDINIDNDKINNFYKSNHIINSCTNCEDFENIEKSYKDFYEKNYKNLDIVKDKNIFEIIDFLKLVNIDNYIKHRPDNDINEITKYENRKYLYKLIIQNNK